MLEGKHVLIIRSACVFEKISQSTDSLQDPGILHARVKLNYYFPFFPTILTPAYVRFYRGWRRQVFCTFFQKVKSLLCMYVSSSLMLLSKSNCIYVFVIITAAAALWIVDINFFYTGHAKPFTGRLFPRVFSFFPISWSLKKKNLQSGNIASRMFFYHTA